MARRAYRCIAFAIRASVQRRQIDTEFVKRGLQAREEARRNNNYVDVSIVLDGLQQKAGASPFLRELIIPCGHSGYVALFDIEDANTVSVLRARHQLEDDYH